MRIKKVARILLILFGIVLLLILSAEGFLNFYLNKRLNKYIETKVNAASEGKYKLSVGSAALSLLGRSFTADNVVLLPDTLLLGNKKKFAFASDRFTLKGIGLINLLTGKEVDISRLDLVAPQIKVYTLSKKSNADSSDVKFGLYSLFSEKYEAVFISEIKISDARVSLFIDNKEQLVSEKNNIEIEKLLVNKSTDRQGKLFFADDVRVTMNHFSYHISDLYSISGRNLSASYKDSVMRIDSIRLVPRHTKKNFGKVSGSQSRVLLTCDNIDLSGTDVAAFVEQNEIRSSRAKITALLISVYLDKNIDFVPIEKPSLQRMIRDIPLLLAVDSVFVRNSNVVYEHLAPGARKPGKLSFSNIDASITGLNNSDTLEATKNFLRLDAGCTFMNASQLNIVYNFPLNTDKEVFECRGELKPMALEAINPILEPVAFMSIKNGRLDQFTFSFKTNEKRSDGSMKCFFHDLDIDVKNKEKSFNPGRKFLFMIARTLLINKNNPDKKGRPGVTRIHYDRYPNKYFFYYTWKSLQSGIMSALGVESTKLLERSDDK